MVKDVSLNDIESLPNHPHIWVRIFVASYFVDSLLAGIKLVTDWLFSSKSFLMKAVANCPTLVQQIAAHLATFLNYLAPIIALLEEELLSDQMMESGQLDLPITGIRSPPKILPHVSIKFRELLKKELEHKNGFKSCALPEDWLLLGTPSLSDLHKTFEFEVKASENQVEETLLRLVILFQSGRKFAKLAERLHLDFIYREDLKYFTAPLPSDCDSSVPFVSRKVKSRRCRRRKGKEPYKNSVHLQTSCPIDEKGTTSVTEPQPIIENDDKVTF